MAESLETRASQESKAPEEITTLLGRGSQFSGKLSFDGAVRIDGTFQGEIASEGMLVVGQEAEITADIVVAQLKVQGRITGNITATRCIEIHAPAQVAGKLVCPELYVEKGVVFNGSCEMPSTHGTPGSAPEPKTNTKESSATRSTTPETEP